MNNAQIMILGTFHFRELDNILHFSTKERKEELKSLINKIIKFKPNKLCVEIRPEKEAKYNELYKKYLNGTIPDMKKELCKAQVEGASYFITDPNDERINFAFNLAKNAGINYINGIDYFDGWTQPEVFEKAKENEELYKKITDSYNVFVEKVMNIMKPYEKLKNIFKYLNTRETNELQHSTCFIPFNYIGEGKDSIGINFVSDWYRRNLNILANLHKLAEPNDRILILYGAGHRKLLSDFINESPDLEYVDSLKYL